MQNEPLAQVIGNTRRGVEREDIGFSKRLASYAAAAGGAVALLGISDTADAKIVYTAVDVNFASTLPTQYVLRPDRIHPALTLSIGNCSNYCTEFQAIGKNGGEIVGYPVRTKFSASDFGASPLAAGQRIGASGNFALDAKFAYAKRISVFSCGSFFGQFGDGYFGFKFSIDGQTHYGWGRITTLSVEGGYGFTLTGFAYETIPNRRILAGQEQGSYAEPGSEDDGPTAQAGRSALGALALGAAGVPIWRKEEDASLKIAGA
jgi:hypothetical protein